MTGFIRLWSISDFLKRADSCEKTKIPPQTAKVSLSRRGYHFSGSMDYRADLSSVHDMAADGEYTGKSSLGNYRCRTAVSAACSLLLTANWKITYDAVGFTYRNYFRQVRYYHYSEITKICRKNDSYIYIGRKRITIDTMALGGTHFLEIAVRQTPKAEHSGFLKR